MSRAIASAEAAEGFRPISTDSLPIFRRDCAGYATFFTPGTVCVVHSANVEAFEATIVIPDKDPSLGAGWGSELARQARYAQTQAERWRQEPFGPECLTLYLNNECNLHCSYCYADPSSTPGARLSLETIAAAAELVAENCRRKRLPFYVVFHGGGEPTLHREKVDSALALLERVAAKHELGIFRYVATNGIMSMEKAVWLARSFDLVGLSCDGPADIHDSQRPCRDGAGVLQILERTAHILGDQGCPMHVRATITDVSLHRQVEIVEYICQQLSPEEIHFEPVYAGGRAGDDVRLGAEQADDFVNGFLEAQAVAQRYGIPLLSSGSRPGSIHGPYCNVFRQVLNLVPGDVATACFKTTGVVQARQKGTVIGTFDWQTRRFEIDYPQVEALRRQLGTVPSECASCFNRYHCVKECPDRCPLDDGPDRSAVRAADFRCRVQRALTAAVLEETAERLWGEVLAEKVQGPRGTAIL